VTNSASEASFSANGDGATFDVGAQRLAQVYAKALLGAGEGSNSTPALLEELRAFCSEVLDKFPAFDKVLSTGTISVAEKEQIIDRVVRGRATPLFTNFIKVVAAHGRLDIVRVILHAAEELYDVARGRVRVQVTTAVPLGNNETSQVTDRLRVLLGKEPAITRKVDPELIGGIVIRSGDTVFDGSVASQLKELAEQMINRSVHEIQSRRDRFRNSTGN
jgi:F-type H+-transporting ATPase subunit delta